MGNKSFENTPLSQARQQLRLGSKARVLQRAPIQMQSLQMERIEGDLLHKVQEDN